MMTRRRMLAQKLLVPCKFIPSFAPSCLQIIFVPVLTGFMAFLLSSGYLAPEYAMRGRLTEKVDVFAFGVVLLETLAGRPNYDDALEEDKIYIFEWVSSVQ